MKNSPNKSFFRTGTIKLFLLFIIFIVIYCFFFLDQHLKYALSIGLEKINGAEVNVEKLVTHFSPPKITIKRIQVANSNTPEINSFELIGTDIQLNWDGILRGKLIIEHFNFEDILLNTKREKVAKVFPKEKSTFVDDLSNFGSDEIDQFKNKNNSNPLGILIQLAEGKSLKESTQSITENLKAENEIKQLEKDFNQFQNDLPKRKKIIDTKISTYENFKFDKNPKKAIEQLKKAKKDYSDLKKEVTQFKNEINDFNNQINKTKKQVDEDLNNIKSAATIPGINVKEEVQELLKKYLLKQFGRYFVYAKKLQQKIPKNVQDQISKKINASNSTKTEKSIDEVEIARNKVNRVYQFPIKGGLPSFWLKEMKININKGIDLNIMSTLVDVSTSPEIIEKYPRWDLKMHGAQFPFRTLTSAIFMDSTSKININSEVGPYRQDKLSLISSADFNWTLENPQTKINIDGHMVNGSYSLIILQELSNFNTILKTSSTKSEKILQKAFGRVTPITFRGKITGTIDHPGISLQSNAGELIAKGIKEQLSEELNEKIKSEKLKQKQKLNKQISEVTNKYNKIKGELLSKLNIKQIDFDQLKKSQLKDTIKKIDLPKVDLKKINIKKLF